MSNIHPLPTDSPQMRQFIFAFQARLLAMSYDMLADYASGGYKAVGDHAKELVRTRFGFSPNMLETIDSNMFPMLRGGEIPWQLIMSTQWNEEPPA